MITLDGFFAGPTGDIDWHVTDEEFDQFAVEQLEETDTLLFGRVTYELMASYWPTDDAKANEPRIAKAMNQQSKIVFSRTLKEVDWENSRLVSEHAEDEVRNLKQQPGKDAAQAQTHQDQDLQLWQRLAVLRTSRYTGSVIGWSY